MTDLTALAEGLTGKQRSRICTLDPDDVDRFGYAPFKGCSQGLFQVEPGWQRMRLSPLGLRVRNHLLKGNGDATA
jgi:hypothetical protein